MQPFCAKHIEEEERESEREVGLVNAKTADGWSMSARIANQSQADLTTHLAAAVDAEVAGLGQRLPELPGPRKVDE